jgi:hypothetical protein
LQCFKLSKIKTLFALWCFSQRETSAPVMLCYSCITYYLWYRREAVPYQSSSKCRLSNSPVSEQRPPGFHHNAAHRRRRRRRRLEIDGNRVTEQVVVSSFTRGDAAELSMVYAQIGTLCIGQLPGLSIPHWLPIATTCLCEVKSLGRWHVTSPM